MQFPFDEPITEERYNDIADYISRLPEPARDICADVILHGEKIYLVAKKHRSSSYRITKIVRVMMYPVAVDLGIVPTPSGTPGRGEKVLPTAPDRPDLPRKYPGVNTHFLSAKKKRLKNERN